MPCVAGYIALRNALNSQRATPDSIHPMNIQYPDRGGRHLFPIVETKQA
jgi:hypothetical protein